MTRYDIVDEKIIILREKIYERMNFHIFKKPLFPNSILRLFIHFINYYIGSYVTSFFQSQLVYSSIYQSPHLGNNILFLEYYTGEMNF